jgi:uncharacterized protein HemY
MLILAGVVLNIVIGGGIFNQAEVAVELTRISQLQEEILKWKQEIKIKGKVVTSIIDKMDELVENGLLTEKERDLLKNENAKGNRI